MNFNEVYDRYSSALTTLIHNSSFWNKYFSSPYELSFEEEDEGEDLFNPHLHIACGAFRGCLIDDTCEYVVKFDLQPSVFHCLHECENYKLAEKASCSQFFAQPYQLGTYTAKNIRLPLYAYPRARTSSIHHHYIRSGRRSYLRSVPSCLNTYVDIANNFYEDYGREAYERLSNFLATNKIDDIHFGNVGYINNKIVIIDYAGT